MIEYHRLLLEDEVRTLAYRTAIFQTVRPGDTVVDLGAGSGILSFFCLQAGARKVYAIETDPILYLAREVAVANGWHHKIEFIELSSWRVTLPERVDCIVSEMFGSFALDENILQHLCDARERFLKPDGKLIPRSVSLWGAPIHNAKAYDRVTVFSENLYGIDFRAARKAASGRPYVEFAEPETFLADPLRLATVDFRGCTQEFLSGKASYPINRDGLVHGFTGWFEAHLSPDVVLTTEPTARRTAWGNIFFPIPEPLPVQQGYRLLVSLHGCTTRAGFQWAWTLAMPERSWKQHTVYTVPQRWELLASGLPAQAST